jgi:hypothetical protein
MGVDSEMNLPDRQNNGIADRREGKQKLTPGLSGRGGWN